MAIPCIVFADVDWIRIILIFVFLVGPLLAQLGRNKPAEKLPQLPRKPKQDRAVPPGRPKPKRLADEIERILVEATEAAQQQDAARAKEQRPRERQRSSRPAAQQPAVKRQALGSGVSQHVQDHMRSHPVGEHSQTLAHGIESADEHVEQHLHDVFDHKLGGLERHGVQSDTNRVAAGTDASAWQGLETERAEQQAMMARRHEMIRGLFRNPEQLRNAFILGEIFRGPQSFQ